MSDKQTKQCEHNSVELGRERGGQGFFWNERFRANDNQYLVVYGCDKCGAVEGVSVVDRESE